MALLEKKGYGQVEPNHLAGQKSGMIFAQLPVKKGTDTVQNGMFMKYDLGAGEINLNGNGEYMLVYSEVKLYDPRETYKDFALTKAQSTDGKIYPRLIGTFPGDIITTNLVDVTTAKGSLAKVFLQVDSATGILKEVEIGSAKAELALWQVIKETTMPDGQYALKIAKVRN